MFHGLCGTNTCCVVSPITCACGWEIVDSSNQIQTGADGLYNCYASALTAPGGCCFIPQQTLLKNCSSGLCREQQPRQRLDKQPHLPHQPLPLASYLRSPRVSINLAHLLFCHSKTRNVALTLVLPVCPCFVALKQGHLFYFVGLRGQ